MARLVKDRPSRMGPGCEEVVAGVRVVRTRVRFPDSPLLFCFRLFWKKLVVGNILIRKYCVIVTLEMGAAGRALADRSGEVANREMGCFEDLRVALLNDLVEKDPM